MTTNFSQKPKQTKKTPQASQKNNKKKRTKKRKIQKEEQKQELKNERHRVFYRQRTKFLKNLNSRKALCFFVGMLGMTAIILFHGYLGFDSNSMVAILYAWCIGISMMSGIWGLGNIKEKEMYLKERRNFVPFKPESKVK